MANALSSVVLAAPVRTPIGKFGGGLGPLSAPELGAHAAQAAIARGGISAEAIDEVIFGHGRQAGAGPNPARQVGHRAGVPHTAPALTVNQACASGLRAVLLAAQQIQLGAARCILAGGMESMSNTPYLLPGARWGYRLGHQPLVDGMYRDGFDCPLCDQRMGETAENLAELYKISRAEQDAYACATQQRCEAARRAGDFEAEIEPVEVPGRRGAQRIERDEHPRDGVTLESLAKLPAVFREPGGVTAGNSSGITDGAAALLVLSQARARELGVAPWARIRGFAVVGVEPQIMGIGPVPATRQALERAGMKLEDLDLIEINEAFAAQVLACQRELSYDPERANIRGGAIALGHPIGASGARILVTLLHAMRRRRASTGLATLCVSGGQGLSLIVEAV